MYVVEHASRHQQKRQCVMLRRSVLLGRSIALIVILLICDGVIVAFLVQRSVAQSLPVKITYLEKLEPEYEIASMKTGVLKLLSQLKDEHILLLSKGCLSFTGLAKTRFAKLVNMVVWRQLSNCPSLGR